MRRNRGEYMKNLKKLTILHSNDMHGDFLAEQIDEAARCAGIVDALQRVEANAIGRSRLAALAGEEEGSRPEQVSGRRCTWPHGGRQMSGGRCDICQRVAYHCGSQ